MSIRKATVLCSFALAVKLADRLGVDGRSRSTLMPTPGFQRLMTMRPMISASVVTTSK